MEPLYILDTIETTSGPEYSGTSITISQGSVLTSFVKGERGGRRGDYGVLLLSAQDCPLPPPLTVRMAGTSTCTLFVVVCTNQGGGGGGCVGMVTLPSGMATTAEHDHKVN